MEKETPTHGTMTVLYGKKTVMHANKNAYKVETAGYSSHRHVPGTTVVSDTTVDFGPGISERMYGVAEYWESLRKGATVTTAY